MKTRFLFIETSIIETLSKQPLRLHELSAVAAVRNEALRLNVRRAGVSPGESADSTVNERLQALRRVGRIAYDRATSRWVGALTHLAHLPSSFCCRSMIVFSPLPGMTPTLRFSTPGTEQNQSLPLLKAVGCTALNMMINRICCHRSE